MTIRECAKFIGVAESTFREWEYGRAIVGEPYLKIAELFETSVGELLGESLGKTVEELKKIQNDLKKTSEKLQKAIARL